MYFWKIDDGRIWSSEAAAFVPEAPEGVEVVSLSEGGRPAGLGYLRKTIRFYGFGLGELAGPDERAQAILAELAEIDRLSIRPLRAEAFGVATEDDSERLAALEAKAALLRSELAGLGGEPDA